MEDRRPIGPGAPIFDHLFAFPNEAEALQRLPAFQLGGTWNRSFVFPDIRIVLARPVMDGGKIMRPQRELGGYRLLVSQREPRTDLWEEVPELEAIASRDKAEASADFYTHVRPGSEPMFLLMEPIPAGARYRSYGREYLAFDLIESETRYVDATINQKEVDEFRLRIEELKHQVSLLTGNNDVNVAAMQDDLTLMLALLQARFINANVIEQLARTTFRDIRTKLAKKVADDALDLVLKATYVALGILLSKAIVP